MTTLAEAQICPKCQQTMELDDISSKAAQPLRGGAKLYFATCRNDRCSWLDTGRMIQTTGDGNVYERASGPRGSDRDFPKVSRDALAFGQRQVEDVVKRDLRDNPL